IERGTLHVAVTTSPSAGTTPPLDIAEGAVVAFCAHSALRTGLVGPLATLPVMRGRGVAAALVSAACVDLMVIGCTKAEIGWVGSEARAFYGRLGARPARRFLHLTRPVS